MESYHKSNKRLIHPQILMSLKSIMPNKNEPDTEEHIVCDFTYTKY